MSAAALEAAEAMRMQDTLEEYFRLYEHLIAGGSEHSADGGHPIGARGSAR